MADNQDVNRIASPIEPKPEPVEPVVEAPVVPPPVEPPVIPLAQQVPATPPLQAQPMAVKPKSGSNNMFIVFLLLLILCAVIALIIVVLATNGTFGNLLNPGTVTPTQTDNVAVTATGTATEAPTPTTEATTAPTATLTAGTYQIYFFDRNKFDEPGASDYLTVKPRTTIRTDMATYCVEQIILGPNASEKAAGLDDTFGPGTFVEFKSASNCGGKDFKLQVVGGKATIQFCRQTFLNGDFAGGIVTDQITRTVKQFSSVSQVRVLNSAGECFNDLAGFTPEECYN